jgi:5'-phosphate synthase pdxT subunit
MVTIGVLALQGDFAEHANMLERLGAAALQVRRSFQLNRVDGLIIPGGESTAIARLTASNNDPIFSAIREHALAGMPVYGTCMGSIFLAKDIEGSTQGRLALMDITVRRNAFGPQRLSFEQLVDIPELGSQPFPAVFIRAPLVLACGPQVKVLSRISQGIIMARQDNLLVSAFHPEITNDTRIHRYFLSMVEEWRSVAPLSLDTAQGGIANTRQVQLA